MKKLAILLFLASVAGAVSAQRVYRSEFAPFDTRECASKGDHSTTIGHIAYNPALVGNVGDVVMYAQSLDVPAAWNDYNAYLHIESVQSAYDVAVNGTIVAANDDPNTPADYFISPYLNQGENKIILLLRASNFADLEQGATASKRTKFSGSYIFTQYRASIFDYDAAVVAREGKLYLELDIIASNNFNYEERYLIGYDIYTPEKRLVDYAVNEIAVPGRGRDTMRVRLDLGAELRYLWSAEKPNLYRATLYLKRNNKPSEYIPVVIGAGRTTFKDGKIYRNGKALTIKSVAYNAQGSYSECRTQLVALKAKGVNTLEPSVPQPEWFYDLCDQLGLYVIESAAINPTAKGDDRTIGGTPSNDLQYLEQYLERVKAMYYRTRNHPCVIAYALGGKEAGNGYCMYKAYQWLKSVELHRAVICRSANGEWNSDL